MQTPNKSIERICENFASSPEARAAVREGRSYLPLLPLLEHPPSDVDARLVAALAAAGVPPDEAARVSLARLVHYALTAEIGAFWGILAVAWIEAGFPADSAIADALERLAEEKRFPQNTRHLAGSLARRWKKNGGTVPFNREIDGSKLD